MKGIHVLEIKTLNYVVITGQGRYLKDRFRLNTVYTMSPLHTGHEAMSLYSEGQNPQSFC